MRGPLATLRFGLMSMIGVMIWLRYGFTGLLIAMPVALVVGVLWVIVKAKWARRGTLR